MTQNEIKHYTESIYYELEQTAKFCKTLGSQMFEKFNIEISTEEFNALDTIICHNGICQRDLAKLILRDRANTGRILNSLEGKGLIKRFVDTKNNRLVRKMEVTEKGRNIWQTSVDKIKPVFNKCFDIIAKEEVEILRQSLKKFRMQLANVVDLQI